MRRSVSRLALALAAALPFAASAAGPLGVCNGAPLKYASGSVALNYDGGGVLGTRSKAAADTIVNNAIALWTNVSTSALTLSRGANLPVDVTSANFSTYLGKYADGLNPVIYDTDGSIIDAVLGVGARSSVLGFAGSASYGAPTCRYAEGQAVINGAIAVSDARMTVVIAHELGHLVGLDHTQLDATQGLASANYPLMYPIAYRSTATLHDDDAASVSMLYPGTSLAATYGEISGTLTTAGVPVRGANVWARETTTNRVYSVVSDYLTANTGYFRLLLPAGTYALSTEPIASDFNGGSSVGPYSDTFPTSPSFLAPMYSGTTPATAVSWGGSSPKTFTIKAGCAATLTLTLAGGGTVGGNCATVVVPPVVPPPPPPTPPPPSGSVPGDANVVYRNFATGQVHVLRLAGLKVAGSAQMHSEPDLAWKIVGRADFNGDGAPDLLWRNATTGQVTMQFFNADDAPLGVAHVWNEPDAGWKVVQTPDLDGDERADIVWWHAGTGQVYAMLMNGATIKRAGVVHTEPDTAWRIVGAGDFAGSGREDHLLWRHAGNGDVYLMKVVSSPSGFSNTGATIYREPRTEWGIVAAADFNGDGKSDILYRNEATGAVYVMLMSGSMVLGGAVVHTEPDLAWKVVALGDYDANGRKDLLWRHEATGELYAMLMSETIVIGQGTVYREPRLEWRVLGAYEFAK